MYSVPVSSLAHILTVFIKTAMQSANTDNIDRHHYCIIGTVNSLLSSVMSTMAARRYIDPRIIRECSEINSSLHIYIHTMATSILIKSIL